MMAAFQPLRVMVVEDEAVVLMQLEALLEDAGHTIVGTAMTADEAIPLILTLHPELVLLDVQLKDGSSGLNVANAVMQHGTTIVFLTANGLKLDENMNGAAGVIAKPFSDRAMEMSIAYLEECVHRPPPVQQLPLSLRLSPAYSSWIASLHPTSL